MHQALADRYVCAWNNSLAALWFVRAQHIPVWFQHQIKWPIKPPEAQWNLDNQDEFQQHDRSLSERFQRVSDQFHEVEAEYAKRTHKRRELEQFIKKLRSIDQLVNEFDEMLWISMVKKVVVATDGRMTFTFTNDMEITVWHCISNKARLLRWDIVVCGPCLVCQAISLWRRSVLKGKLDVRFWLF